MNLSYNSTVLLLNVGVFTLPKRFCLASWAVSRYATKTAFIWRDYEKLRKTSSNECVTQLTFQPSTSRTQVSLQPTVLCQAYGNTERANNFKMSSTKLIYNIHFGRSSLCSRLIARMNLHFNHSISQNVRQNKEVGVLFIKTRGNYKTTLAIRHCHLPTSECRKCRLAMVKQYCAVFHKPIRDKSIDAGAITSPIITVADYHYVPHCNTTYRL